MTEALTKEVQAIEVSKQEVAEDKTSATCERDGSETSAADDGLRCTGPRAQSAYGREHSEPRSGSRTAERCASDTGNETTAKRDASAEERGASLITMRDRTATAAG